MVVNEAMSVGLRVISRGCAGRAAVFVEDGLSELLVRPRDIDGLAEATSRVITDPQTRGRMGQIAREKVMKDFTPKNQAKAMNGAITATLNLANGEL